MANPIAVPGTVVSSGAAVSPGGAQGPTALSANANNKATLGTDSLLLVQGTAAGVAATTHAQTVSGDDPQLTNARTPTAHEASHVTGSDQIPLASSSTKGLLNQTSGNTTDFIDGTNNSQALQPVIWSVRLRSFNAVGNPTFEVDQRNAGNAQTNPANGTFIQDRYALTKVGTMTVNVAGAQPPAAGNEILLPGTNFMITRTFLNIQLTVQETTLAASDSLAIAHFTEGPRLRELYKDVHSFQILCRSSVANLKFGISLRDPPTITKSLTKLCQLGAANTWTLITLPNLPLWPSAGNFSTVPGVEGYRLAITLAAGSTLISPANDTWQNGNFIGAVGQDNFAAQAVNSTFNVAFIQQEPGALCTTPIDCPFQQAYDDALRYFTKSYDYDVAVGAVSSLGVGNLYQTTTTQIAGAVRYPKPMAKNPTVTIYNHSSGAANSVQHQNATAYAVSSVVNVGKSGFNAINTATMPAVVAGAGALFHYTADTGW